MPTDKSSAAAPHEAPIYNSIESDLRDCEYRDVVAAIRSATTKGQVTFTILLDSHSLPQGQHVLADESIIAIPKKALRKAFLTARLIFFQSHQNEAGRALWQETIFDSSTVMLLFDPEHLTAANARKRIILASESKSNVETRRYILMDLWLLDLLFQSQLNKHTKSPTLWAHRRWLLQRLPSSEPLNKEVASTGLLRIEKEIAIIALAAAGIHSRNYYAWGHIRWCISNNPALLQTFGQCPESRGSAPQAAFGLSTMANLIVQWCLSHPSDTSGWSFLLWLLTCDATSNSTSLSLYGPHIAVNKKVLGCTRSWKLRNESLWVFLRTVMASQDVPHYIFQEYIDEAESVINSKTERHTSQSTTRAALRWSAQYGWAAPRR